MSQEINPSAIDIRFEKPSSIFMFCKKCWDYKEFDTSQIKWDSRFANIKCKQCGNIQKIDLDYASEYYKHLNDENN